MGLTAFCTLPSDRPVVAVGQSAASWLAILVVDSVRMPLIGKGYRTPPTLVIYCPLLQGLRYSAMGGLEDSDRSRAIGHVEL